MEKFGDWVCFKCRNINFSYRSNCNRCNISKLISTKLGLDQEVSRIITKNINYDIISNDNEKEKSTNIDVNQNQNQNDKTKSEGKYDKKSNNSYYQFFTKYI